MNGFVARPFPSISKDLFQLEHPQIFYPWPYTSIYYLPVGLIFTNDDDDDDLDEACKEQPFFL